MSARLILGSASPRRLAILKQIGLHPAHVVAADINEDPHKKELPSPYCLRIACEKNAAIAAQYPNDYIVTADTTCAIGRRILGKAADRAEAAKMLQLLSGRAHRIYTGLAVRAPDGRMAARVHESRVKVKRLSDAELIFYLDTQEWEDKAGAYHLGGVFTRFITHIAGTPTSILGLPAFDVAQMLHGLGYAVLAKDDNESISK